MHAYEGGRKRQTSERFTNKNNRKELLDTLIYIFGLVAYYPHFIKDGVGCEADNATPMLDNEKSFEVSNYPHIYDGVGNDTDESKNLLL